MNLLAQHGHQQSDKIARALDEGIIDGAIFSSRYVRPTDLPEKIAELRNVAEDAELLLDPEFYATRQIGTPNSQLRYLTEWSYFKGHRRRDLVKTRTVTTALQTAFESVSDFDLSAHIAPNIYIPQSFDSMAAGIALNFIAGAKTAFGTGEKPVYATLAVDRRAILSPSDFRSFLNDITALDNPPDGFYVIIGGGLINERSNVVHSEIIDSNVIAGWMLINHSLSINGFRVINGYSDILTPFLCCAGGSSGATGWWSNLRIFTMGRYIRPEGRGGRQPNIRYLSKLLLNRITQDERIAYSRILPEVNNDLDCDDEYAAGMPSRTVEALQAWEAISALNGDVALKNIEEGLDILKSCIDRACEAYTELQTYGIAEGFEAIMEYFDQLAKAVEKFRDLAEL